MVHKGVWVALDARVYMVHKEGAAHDARMGRQSQELKQKLVNQVGVQQTKPPPVDSEGLQAVAAVHIPSATGQHAKLQPRTSLPVWMVASSAQK